MKTLTILLRDPDETRTLGRSLGHVAGPGSVVLLRGAVGAGKTTLAQGVLAVWAGVADAASPTYTLIHTYPGEVYHVDLYRLEAAEAWELGLEDVFTLSSRVLVEWPERAPDLIPVDRLVIRLGAEGGGRRAEITAEGERSQRVVEALSNRWTTMRQGGGGG